jgi:hypothetical protein
MALCRSRVIHQLAFYFVDNTILPSLSTSASSISSCLARFDRHECSPPPGGRPKIAHRVSGGKALTIPKPGPAGRQTRRHECSAKHHAAAEYNSCSSAAIATHALCRPPSPDSRAHKYAIHPSRGGLFSFAASRRLCTRAAIDASGAPHNAIFVVWERYQLIGRASATAWT